MLPRSEIEIFYSFIEESLPFIENEPCEAWNFRSLSQLMLIRSSITSKPFEETTNQRKFEFEVKQ